MTWADRYWKRVLWENPTLATFYGVHDHDDRLLGPRPKRSRPTGMI